MSCIGTAGHIDHGKSTLVEALTGIDPDRLAEEKARGMTIDLGFAWLTLPNGREVSIVDVPGHESFIKNMLAGVGGIDAALLVVAADESVMPQTREHLAILDLLGVKRGVVAITKADLVDEEWLELVREEVYELLKPTTLAGASIIPVSAHTHEGLPELLVELEHMLEQDELRQDIARPRLPIDRVFTITGFGTIVTGTLLDGSLRTGQEVEILPAALRTRIRTLQTHKHQVELAHPGSRVALNLASVARTNLARGNVVVLPDQFQPTVLLDARVQVLASATRPLTHNMQVDFYSGSQEVSARLRLLDAESIEPGQQGWVQLRLNQPAVLARRDRFILRISSPGATIGGGEVIDTHPRYHRRLQAPVLSALAILEKGSPDELLLAALDHRRESSTQKEGSVTSSSARSKTRASSKAGRKFTGYELNELASESNLSYNVTLTTLETLLKERRVRKVGVWWFARTVWDALSIETTRLLSEHHRQYPLRSGLPREEWRVRIGLPQRMATDIFLALQEENILAEGSSSARVSGSTGGLIRLPGFTPTFNEEHKQRIENILYIFRANPLIPPGRVEVEEAVGTEVLGALLEQGILVKLGNAGDTVLFLNDTYKEAVVRLVAYLHEHGTITVAEARDTLGTTRKYILPLLEHLDERHITRRLGDQRVLVTVQTPLQQTLPESYNREDHSQA